MAGQQPTVLYEGPHRGEHIISEANGWRSRGVVTIAAGQNLVAGTVLAKITADGKYAQLDPGAGTGEETALAVLFDHVDASVSDQAATVTQRDSEVNLHHLTWPEGITTEQHDAAITDLEKVGIIVRS